MPSRPCWPGMRSGYRIVSCSRTIAMPMATRKATRPADNGPTSSILLGEFARDELPVKVAIGLLRFLDEQDGLMIDENRSRPGVDCDPCARFRRFTGR